MSHVAHWTHVDWTRQQESLDNCDLTQLYGGGHAAYDVATKFVADNLICSSEIMMKT